MDGWMDGVMDRRTDGTEWGQWFGFGQTDGQSDRRMGAIEGDDRGLGWDGQTDGRT